MTTGRFESLIYTDCRAGQGLLGAAGLQFQSVSSGVDQDVMRLVQRHLLYEPPARWMRERRPPTDYPPSFAYLGGNGTFVAASGLYLGREVNGSREGNQLTHSIVTTDVDTFQLVRPAQLFGAAFWRTEPASGTTCEPVPADWRPGPFDVERVRAAVAAQPEGERRLACLVTALRQTLQPSSPRVLFVSRHAEAVMNWLVAGTLLLPQRTALEIGFKLFTTNSAYAHQRVLSVHPDWGDTPLSDAYTGYIVFDLERPGRPRIEPTRADRRWARMFLHEDPYDVTDAVEVAAATGLGQIDEAQAVAITCVFRRRPSVANVGHVARWLATGDGQLIDAYAERAINVIVDPPTGWPPDVLPRLDAALRTGRVTSRRTVVREAVVLAAIDSAARGEGVDTSVPVGRSTDEPLPDAAKIRRTLISAIGDAPPDRIDALLTVAHRYSIPVSLADLGAATAPFVRHWADNPRLRLDPTRWTCGRELRSLLRAELDRRVSGGHGDDIGREWWSQLLPSTPRATTRLDLVMLAAAMEVPNATDGRELVERFVNTAQSGTDGPGTIRAVTGALFRLAVPDVGDVGTLCRVDGAANEIDPAIFDRFVRSAVDAKRLSARMLDALSLIAQTFPRYYNPELTHLVEQDRELIRLAAAARPGPIEELRARMKAIDERIRDARRSHNPDLLFTETSLKAVRLALDANPHLTRNYCHRLVEELRSRTARPDQAAVAFFLGTTPSAGAAVDRELHSKDNGLKLKDRLNDAVFGWAAKANRIDLFGAEAHIAELGERWLKAWRDMVASGGRGRLGRLMRRVRGGPAGSVS